MGLRLKSIEWWGVCCCMQQVLEFFRRLIRILGDNASINFDLRMHDGMTVGVSWKLGNRIRLAVLS